MALQTRILLRNDTLANWGSSTLTLGKGEVAIATGLDGNLVEVRVGNGTTTWSGAAKLAVDASQISGIVQLIQGTAKKYQVVANGEGGNSWKLQEAALSGGNWSDVADSTWTVDFSAINDQITALTSDVNSIKTDLAGAKTALNTVSSDYLKAADKTELAGVDTYISGQVDAISSTLKTVSSDYLKATDFATISNDTGLSAASASNPVVTKNDIASLDKVMHFKGVVNAVPSSTTGYEVGDVVLVAGATGEAAKDNGKEFVLVDVGESGSPVLKWELIGDQNAISALTEYVDTKIVGLSNAVTTDYATKNELTASANGLSTDYNTKFDNLTITYATKTEVSDTSSYLSGAVDDLSNEITAITGAYATKDYVNGISSSLSTETHNEITAVVGQTTDLSTANTIYGAKKYAEGYTNAAIADLEIDKYATKDYVNGISSALSTDYSGKIKAVDDKLTGYALSADVTSEIDAAKSKVIGEATDLSSAGTINGAKAYAKDYTDEAIAGLSVDNFIKHGEVTESDLSGFFILDCGASTLRTGEPIPSTGA